MYSWYFTYDTSTFSHEWTTHLEDIALLNLEDASVQLGDIYGGVNAIFEIMNLGYST